MPLADVRQGRRKGARKKKGSVRKGKENEQRQKTAVTSEKCRTTSDIFLDSFHKFPILEGHLAF